MARTKIITSNKQGKKLKSCLFLLKNNRRNYLKMMLSAGSYKIVNHRVKVENQTLLLSERKRGFTAKKPKNFCYLNKYIVYCSSFYPVSLNLPDSWEVLSFEELNKLGIYFFKMEFEGFYYLVKIDIKTGLFELSEDKEKNRKAG